MLVSRSLPLALLFGAAITLVGCGPDYPNCENDEHCAPDRTSSAKQEYCLNKLCQQCRDNSHCEGPGMMCAGGKCARRPGYCDNSVPCPGSQKCRDNECGPQCLDNAECGGGEFCQAGSCVSKPECGDNADNPSCPEGQECIGGRCQVKLAACGFSGDPVYFAFDQASIRGNQRRKIDGLAQCLKGGNAANVTVAGHCDERGTEEYNLALGQRRADAVRRYLENLGVDGSKLSTVSYGEERPAVQGSNRKAWSKNRRAEAN